MSTPYETTADLAIGGSDSEGGEILAIPFPSRTFLHKMLVVCLDDNEATSFSVALFNRNPADFDEVTVFADNHRVCPVQSSDGGPILYFPGGVPFYNMDTPNHLGNVRRIYALVAGPEGTYRVTLGGHSDVG